MTAHDEEEARAEEAREAAAHKKAHARQMRHWRAARAEKKLEKAHNMQLDEVYKLVKTLIKEKEELQKEKEELQTQVSQLSQKRSCQHEALATDLPPEMLTPVRGLERQPQGLYRAGLRGKRVQLRDGRGDREAICASPPAA